MTQRSTLKLSRNFSTEKPAPVNEHGLPLSLEDVNIRLGPKPSLVLTASRSKDLTTSMADRDFSQKYGGYFSAEFDPEYAVALSSVAFTLLNLLHEES